MAEEAKTKKSVAKNVGDIGGDETTFQGTPKDKYFGNIFFILVKYIGSC